MALLQAEQERLPAMSAEHIIISGPSGLATRLEINDFIKHEKFFTLFIKAFLRMQNTDEMDDKSFFAVAGIHGQPYTAWNGASGSFTQEKWGFGGYCTHGSVLFPTWHRPYLLLLEQIIQEHAIEIATHFLFDQAEWKQAALNLRLPYWDWVSNSVPPDCVIVDETVSIMDYEGYMVKVDNPLIRFRFFQRHSNLFDGPFGTWATTLRHPDVHGIENVEELIQTLKSSQSRITDDIVALLSWVHDWDSFSNHSAHENSITNSLEAIHDQIHVDIGGTGHMAEISVAAFDPIFFLHHCNLDRLVSIWSVINGGKGVSAGKNDGDGTFTLAPRADLNEYTGLAPFWNTDNTFWSSKLLFDTEKLGYTYPDFARSDVREVTHDNVRVAAEKYIEGIHGSFSMGRDVDQWWNWSVRIHSKKFELGRSFSILIFLGEVPENPDHWASSRSFVGVHHVPANNAAERCQNCRANVGSINEGFIHLNRHLLGNWPLCGILEPADLSSFLVEKLRWRVTDIHGNTVRLDSLEISLVSVPLIRRPGFQHPTVDVEKLIFRHRVILAADSTLL